MTDNTTLAIRLKPDAEERLARLSASPNRTRADLAAEAITTYVAREMAIVEGIHRGLADIEAGRLVPHDDAMAEIDDEIDSAVRGCK